MDDQEISDVPSALGPILKDTEDMGFTMHSEAKTGAFLRTLAASKPGGRFLELGTGTGVSAAWLLDGMDDEARLETVDNDPQVQRIAKRHLGHDSRVTFHLEDGAEFLARPDLPTYDLVFADAWAGKYTNLNKALPLVKVGGYYLIDDLSPQPNWPNDHAPKVPVLISELEERPGFINIKLDWASGLMLLVRSA